MKKKVLVERNIRKLCVASMLMALEIVLSRFLSINTAGWKIGFAFVPAVLAAMLYGPAVSAAVCALSDFLGAILFPIGPYHPGFTVCAALMGLVYGFFLYQKQADDDAVQDTAHFLPWKELHFVPNILLPVLWNCLFLGLCVNTVWVSMLYGKRTYFGWFLYRLPEYALKIPVELLIIPILLKLCRILQKKRLV